MTEQHTSPPPVAPEPAVDSIGTSEAEYLRQQADEAKIAVMQALQQAKKLLAEKVDPRALAGKHPLLTLGTAATAGFLGAFFAIPSKEQQELRRLAKIRRAMHPEPDPVKSADGTTQSKVPGQPFWMAMVKEAIALLRPILTTLITANLAANKPSHDGADSSPPSASN